ncbi:MAG: hypothetical protein A2287_08965 [Candidatus Melainabacteria bacterium RIFOXYA12_FULL_32_12]|nr:MAG: hypothetical protein A2255_10880 [Candidatus Melainabacteria bacterium RIFOXYA2_FULL_32_9]OGI31101.1 MAG: hypothetical protein A2287_08965 [Candidatus Melainabacteria bacterium RIFOXYA12_FULL_32_12]
MVTGIGNLDPKKFQVGLNDAKPGQGMNNTPGLNAKSDSIFTQAQQTPKPALQDAAKQPDNQQNLAQSLQVIMKMLQTLMGDQAAGAQKAQIDPAADAKAEKTDDKTAKAENTADKADGKAEKTEKNEKAEKKEEKGGCNK